MVSMLAVNVNGNLSLAAAKTTLECGVLSFIFNLISGIPFSPKLKISSPKTSNLAIFSGISFSKFFTSDNESKMCCADFATVTFGLSKFIVVSLRGTKQSDPHYCYFIF